MTAHEALIVCGIAVVAMVAAFTVKGAMAPDTDPAGVARPRFDSITELREWIAISTQTLVHLPGWPGSMKLSSLSDAIHDLPSPDAIVFYGSSVRGRGYANDIDVLWLCDDETKTTIESRHFTETHLCSDGYGVDTVRGNWLHVAVCHRGMLAKRRAENHEWAETIARDGVVLAGKPDMPGGGIWPRAFKANAHGNLAIADLLKLPDATTPIEECVRP